MKLPKMKSPRVFGKVFGLLTRADLVALSLVCSIAASVLPQTAHAEKMNSETHTLVIQKLESALANAKEDETVSLRPVRARLADLYADRARLRSMEESENGAKAKGSFDDRKKALALYRVVEREAPAQGKGTILLQMAHLFEMNNERSKALELYERLIREGVRAHDRSIVALGYAGRGESRFSAAKFKLASEDFQQAITLSPPDRRGPLVHRVAWCDLNMGNQQQAVRLLVKILKTPDLLMRESTEGSVLDVSFQDDVVDDLGTFIARGEVHRSDIELIKNVSPEKTKRDHLKHFASELDRLGSKRAALMAWEAVIELNGNAQDQLETVVRVARLRFDLGDRKGAQEGFTEAVGLWKKNGCTDETTCQNLHAGLKNLVVEWDRVEKKKPTEALLATYRAYLSQFSDDMPMTFGAALVAREMGRNREASSLYHKTSMLVIGGAKDPKIKEYLESSLVGEVEVAELSSKDTDKSSDAAKKIEGFAFRQAAYDHYLKYAPNGAIAHQVRYQRARLPYEQGNMKEAVERLAEFAAGNDCASGAKAGDSLCIQAADLDLDSRVLLKDDRGIERSALNYARIYPSRRNEYFRIARTSALKQSEAMSGDEAIAKLATINMSGANQDEQLRILKTRITLAEKAKNLVAVRQGSQELLKVKNLNAADKEFAIGRMAWAAEMSFDFGQAYELSKKLEMKQLKPDEREMRLALLAELAGRSPRPHEEKFLQISKKAEARALVRAKIVRASSNPVREMAKQEQELSRFPKIMAPLAFEIFARTGDKRFAERMLKERRLMKEPGGRALARQLFLIDFSKLEPKIAHHQIRTSSEAMMQATLQQRLKLMNEIEVAANRAISSKDWTSQLVTLAVVARENKRLYTDIMALPVPRKLKGKDRETYMKMVASQAQVFQQKFQAINVKLDGFWKDTASLTELTNDYQNSRPGVRVLLSREMRMISAVAPAPIQKQIASAMSDEIESPSIKAIASATQDARQRPFNERMIERLKKLEAGRGQDTMVAYLDARLTKLKEGDK